MKCNIFDIDIKNKILILVIIVLILIALNMYISKSSVETFVTNNDIQNLERVEQMCNNIEKKRKLDEQLEEIEKNEKMHFQLTELDKKIEELTEIVADLTSKNKKQKYINKKCRSNKQSLVNKNYDILNKLNEKGLVNNDVLKVNVNVSDKLRQIKRMGSVRNSASSSDGQCKRKRVSKDMINLTKNKALIEDKCMGCKTDKLIR